MPIFKLAKKNEKLNVKLKHDKLIIGRSTYTVRPKDNLHQLPPDLNPINTCKEENDDTYTFFGKRHPFSNFNASPTVIQGELYPTTEHYIQEQKALTFSNTQLAEKIRNCQRPDECKKLSKDVVNYHHQTWIEKIPEVLHTALTCKFEQHPPYLNLLKAVKSKTIGEASKDKIWGTGVELRNNNCLNINMWEGQNLMGKALTRISQELC